METLMGFGRGLAAIEHGCLEEELRAVAKRGLRERTPLTRGLLRGFLKCADQDTRPWGGSLAARKHRQDREGDVACPGT
ncbi:hypothetical protein NDU88_001299 [Pleurodeles waltl]|uniref:Uncharacterized protein n=1 Tax=Pleurodeles waltl TaxID=8319 RepID=A0AAV7SZR1_PLEWA|nr:hypothetical protein NDU88_001299 [Pleurodeles waltl]